MNHEITAREYLRAQKRMCRSFTDCGDENQCPFIDECGKLTERGIEIVEKWAAAHPEETLEPLGNNIYFDPKHMVVPDEIVRVFTVEITQIGTTEHTEEYLKSIGQAIADEFAAKAYPYNIDDVKCVRAQQFITKCHEEEV